MRRIRLGLVFGTTLGVFSVMAAPVPSAAGEVHPLLIGAEVPPAMVRDAAGEQVDLSRVVREKPSVVLFYRGGW